MLSATVIIVEVISYKSSLGCPGENFIPYVINYSADRGELSTGFWGEGISFTDSKREQPGSLNRSLFITSMIIISSFNKK